MTHVMWAAKLVEKVYETEAVKAGEMSDANDQQTACGRRADLLTKHEMQSEA